MVSSKKRNKFLKHKLKKIGFGMLSSATIASNYYSINKRQYFENLKP